MKKLIFLILLLSLSFTGFSNPDVPPIAYPDAFHTTGSKEEIYKGNDDWTIYYTDIEWEDFLLYQLVLVKKGYEYEGGTPEWVTAYINNMDTKMPKLESPVKLTARKEGWAQLSIRYYIEGATSPGCQLYNMSTKILPGEDLLAGKKGKSLKPEDYEAHAEHRDNMKEERKKE